MPSMEEESLMSYLVSLHHYNFVLALKDSTEVKRIYKKNSREKPENTTVTLVETQDSGLHLGDTILEGDKVLESSVFCFPPCCRLPARKVSFPVLSFCKQRENMDAVDE